MDQPDHVHHSELNIERRSMQRYGSLFGGCNLPADENLYGTGFLRHVYGDGGQQLARLCGISIELNGNDGLGCHWLFLVRAQ